MKEKLRKVFTCDHCGKKYFVGGACLKHEMYCHMNPNNKHKCYTCAYLEKYQESTGSGVRTRYICSKKKVAMFGYVAERKGLVGKIEANERELGFDCERMPLTCNVFEEKVHEDYTFLANSEISLALEKLKEELIDYE